MLAGPQGKKKSGAKQWIEYDSNVAEVDGSIHVFSDAAMSEDEDDGIPRRVQEKHVLLDHVPQVTFLLSHIVFSKSQFLHNEKLLFLNFLFWVYGRL